MGINPKKQADSLFLQIGIGRENALPRPSNGSIDRALRERVAIANENGDCIINPGIGYYRPRPDIPVERLEYNEYIAKENARAKRILRKNKRMSKAYREKEAGYEFEAEGSTGRAGACESYQQLRLSL